MAEPAGEVRNLTVQLPSPLGGERIEKVQVEDDRASIAQEFRYSALALFAIEGDILNEFLKSCCWLSGATFAAALVALFPKVAALVVGVPGMIAAALTWKAWDSYPRLRTEIAYRLFVVVVGLCAGVSRLFSMG